MEKLREMDGPAAPGTVTIFRLTVASLTANCPAFLPAMKSAAGTVRSKKVPTRILTWSPIAGSGNMDPGSGKNRALRASPSFPVVFVETLSLREVRVSESEPPAATGELTKSWFGAFAERSITRDAGLNTKPASEGVTV